MDMQKFGAELIETSAEIGLVVGRQFVFLMRPNLVEHASEIDKTTDFCRWAANAQLAHRLSILRIRASPSSLIVPIAVRLTNGAIKKMRRNCMIRSALATPANSSHCSIIYRPISHRPRRTVCPDRFRSYSDCHPSWQIFSLC